MKNSNGKKLQVSVMFNPSRAAQFSSPKGSSHCKQRKTYHLARKLKTDNGPGIGAIEEDFILEKAQNYGNFFKLNDLVSVEHNQNQIKPVISPEGKVKPTSIVGPPEIFEKLYSTHPSRTLKKQKSIKELKSKTRSNDKNLRKADPSTEFSDTVNRIQEWAVLQKTLDRNERKVSTISQRLLCTRDKHSLDTFKHTSGKWGRVGSSLSRQLNKPPSTLLLNSGSLFREKIETLNYIDSLTPPTEKIMNLVWYTSLRSAGNMYYPVGPDLHTKIQLRTPPERQIIKPSTLRTHFRTSPYFQQRYPDFPRQAIHTAMSIEGRNKYELEFSAAKTTGVEHVDSKLLQPPDSEVLYAANYSPRCLY